MKPPLHQFTVKVLNSGHYSIALHFGFIENRKVYDAKTQLPGTGNMLYLKSGGCGFLGGITDSRQLSNTRD
ncbi:hypothetical protein [Nitrosomonas oligotropha]|uniref:hypothetical protein n=1 Tax=Nitrosomonas oligotropha TaxID=42354 RepID=UPI00136B6EE6|nr:hypothetical protein [Nitrosomonas oligotropha]MXS83943.1 hypothetical protein [Nitrosomonas oligotropha]